MQENHHLKDFFLAIGVCYEMALTLSRYYFYLYYKNGGKWINSGMEVNNAYAT